MVSRFVTDWQRERPPVKGRRHGRRMVTADEGPISAYDWLSAESGISRDQIDHIAGRSYPYTSLTVAEAIAVGALERPDVFHDGTLPIVANPNASARARAACCSGSTPLALTGDAAFQ